MWCEPKWQNLSTPSPTQSDTAHNPNTTMQASRLCCWKCSMPVRELPERTFGISMTNLLSATGLLGIYPALRRYDFLI